MDQKSSGRTCTAALDPMDSFDTKKYEEISQKMIPATLDFYCPPVKNMFSICSLLMRFEQREGHSY